MRFDSSSTTPSPPSIRLKLIFFALLCVVVLVGVIGYAVYSPDPMQRRGVPATPVVATGSQQLADVRKLPHILFRNTALGPSYGRLCAALLDAPDGLRFPTALSCERVYGTGGAGFCLQANRKALTTFKAVYFDHSFEILHTFNLAGGPSRTRVSRNGHWAAATVFVAGDSYAASGFSTRTTIYDLRTGTLVGELEEFGVTKDDERFKQADFNFWGVTFADDGDRFYATLASGGVFYLVEGRVSSREMRVIRTGVECPSLSPDGGRLAFKSRTSEIGRRLWRLHVLDLKTQTEVVVNEPSSVDDQAEWLDADHVLYALPRNVPGSGAADIWVARADGTGTPRVFIRDATSPCVVRP